MATTDLDFSSYPKPALPVNPLDLAGKLGGLQSQALQINQQKLDQTNQALGYMTRAMGSLGPNATTDQYIGVAQNAVKMGLVPPEMLNTYVERARAAKSPQEFYNEFMTAAVDHQQSINYHLGQPGSINTGQAIQPTLTSPKPGFGVRSTGLPIQTEAPPTTPTIDPATGQPTILGGVRTPPAPGSVSAPPPVNSLPVSQPEGARPFPPGPSSNLGGTPISIDYGNGNVQKPQQQAQAMVPRGPVTGFAPGVAEGEQIAGQGSGTQLAADRVAATNFQRDIFPLAQAIPALEKLGTKGTGPGTETINHLKSFVLSNVPGVKETDFNGTVADYDKSKKYLTDFVNQTGNSGTNDKLAAAFAGNPSVGISNAAAVDVAKSAMALRRMKQAQYQEFESKNLPASQYSKWAAQRTNELDPRAFGVDMMDDNSKKKLLDRLNKNPKEKRQFEQSLELAHSLGFLTPFK